MRRRDHAPRYCFAVQKLAVLSVRFECVTDCMAEVQDSSKTVLPLISRDDLSLQPYTGGNQVFDVFAVALQDAVPPFLESFEKFGVPNDATLNRFIKAGAKLTVG